MRAQHGPTWKQPPDVIKREYLINSMDFSSTCMKKFWFILIGQLIAICSGSTKLCTILYGAHQIVASPISLLMHQVHIGPYLERPLNPVQQS